ncbi:Uncharacterised protein [Salmonella enterica subsp. enterica]|uniref:Uncharacterized protein n=1 Tax=Salmonella enterica I TaxID=59201 RepID=A0A3S4H9Y0_SALET|nr:Uncharacterised protein [Salmonella enterica subsp. enterica]
MDDAKAVLFQNEMETWKCITKANALPAARCRWPMSITYHAEANSVFLYFVL